MTSLRGVAWSGWLFVGCAAPQIPPIELDLSTNCPAVEAIVTVAGIQSPTRPWETVFAAHADRPGRSAAWLLAAYEPLGAPTIGLFHVDEDGVVDREWNLGASVASAGALELVPGAVPGSIFVTRRAEYVFTAERFELSGDSPRAAASPNLATIPAPCDDDGDLEFEICDASTWTQALVLLGGSPYALTFPPSSGDFSVEITPTQLDAYLTPSIAPDRTMDFRPSCDSDLSIEDFEVCQAELGERAYPTLVLSGLQGSASGGFVALSLYREVKQGDDPITFADAPLFLLGISELGAPTGVLRVDPELPEPRDITPRSLALDANATYMHFTALDGDPVLVRAGHSDLVFERLDEVYTLAPEAELAQLDDDIAMHRVVDGAWEVLKIFPDAPEQSQTLVYEADGEIAGVEPAGPGTFLVRTAEGLADLVHLRCVIEEM